MRTSHLLAAAILVCSWHGVSCAATHEAFTDPAKAGPDFAVQGEYQGELQREGKGHRVGVQVIARGGGAFDAVLYPGGLPGDAITPGGAPSPEKLSGKTEGGKTKFPGPKASGEIVDGQFVVTSSGGEKLGTLKKVERRSPTLGAAPPQGAIVLFDGTNTDHFPGAKMTDDHLLMVPAMGKEDFKDFLLHVEFRLPFMPTASGQGRANSGVYLQNRYEVQVLDSFGLEGVENECGAIYLFQRPKVNMCFPPLAWQTYDIDFRAARFDGEKRTQKAQITVQHNGVKVMENYEPPDKTPGGANTEAPGLGPFALQFHGNPVVYRNIWVLKKKE